MDVKDVKTIEDAIAYFNEEIAGPAPTLNNQSAYIAPIEL